MSKNKELSTWKNYGHTPDRTSSSLWAIACDQLSAEISHNAGLHIHSNSQWHLQDLEALSPAIPEALVATMVLPPGNWNLPPQFALPPENNSPHLPGQAGSSTSVAPGTGEGLHSCQLGRNSSSLSHTSFKRASGPGWCSSVD